MNNMIFFLSILFVLIQGCASSNITREANDNVAVGYQNAASNFSSFGEGSAADTYANTNQAVKGAIIGGAAGAVVGGVTSGVGVVPGLASGAILGGSYGAYIDSNTTLTDKLENRGVKTMVLGDHIMLVMHSDYIFNPMSPVIKPGAYPTLDLIAKFINNYHTMAVKVAAYTSSTGTQRVNYALSKEQAESIVRYLWRCKLNTRLISAVGMGGTNPVVPDTLENSDKSLNYRIEITMENMPVSGTLS